MRPQVPAFLLLFALTAVPLYPEELACGTSPEHNQWLRELGAWSAAKARAARPRDRAIANSTRDGDIVIVPADDTNAPFRRSFDLAGRTLVFEPQGASSFLVRNVPLEWNGGEGTLVPIVAGENYGIVNLDFDFPFHGSSVRTLYVSAYNGIYFDQPGRTELRQYGDLNLATEQRAVIAPLLTTPRARLTTTPTIDVAKDATSAAITWTTPGAYSVRATLHASGEIRFSYLFVNRTVAASAVVITSGAEAWRHQRSAIAEGTDATGDIASGLTPDMAGMVDITNVSVDRVGDLNLFELRIRTRTPVDPVRLAESGSVQFAAVFGSTQSIRFVPAADGRDRYILPVWGTDTKSSAARIESDELVMTFTREHIDASTPTPIQIRIHRDGRLMDMTDPMTVVLPPSARSVRTDFSAVSETLLNDEPILEAFTAPILSVYRVWEQVKAIDPTLTEANIDGVAIYQNFFTDIVTYAGAYSTGGNAAVSGLANGDSEYLFEPRAPALMHMNAIGYGHNRTEPGASRLILHEFGHRWLLFTSIFENGVRTRKLNPLSAHPAQYVDTRAAFPVVTETDTSVMGGGFFTDRGDGTFTSAAYGPYGYSWLDLYLMGMVSPQEVPQMFYLDESNPELGGEYYAPPNEIFNGVRRNFTIDQIVDATGTRRPAFPQTQRNFRLVFVMVSDPDRPVRDAEIAAINDYRGFVERDFPIATGGRGSISTILAPPTVPVRRRAAPK